MNHQEFSKKGGQSKSEKKRLAAKQNLAKARLKRGDAKRLLISQENTECVGEPSTIGARP